jgi:hypothetical protein
MKKSISPAIICVSLLLATCKQETSLSVLQYDDFSHYVDQFNQGDNELYIQHIPNDGVSTFLENNIPLIDIPDKELEKIYYFRWWTYRKHIKSTSDGFVITEFLPDVPWAGRHNTISCPAAHHIYEGRWLRDPSIMEDYIHFWLNDAGDGIRSYSFWVADALLAHSKANRREGFIEAELPGLLRNYEAWETEKRDAPERLFWQIDDRDGMEFGASGRIINQGKIQGGTAAVRPTINSYMYGDAMAIAALAELLDKKDIASTFHKKAHQIKDLVQQRLWNDSLSFFTVMPREYTPETQALDIREIIGYLPWYFNLPDDRPEYGQAWAKLMDTTGFYAPFGLTVCEQLHPYFDISYEGHACQWNGPSWPFATTQTLKALANFLNNYEHSEAVSRADYYGLLKQFANSHRITLDNGEERPWIDENLNPFTGDWISRTRLKTWENGTWSKKKGGVERGKDYNHSGFCDLVITDLIGFKPQLDKSIKIEPLVPESWDWFCLDRINYHGKNLTIIWDRDGSRYARGQGFKVYCDGQLVFESDAVVPVVTTVPEKES